LTPSIQCYCYSCPPLGSVLGDGRRYLNLQPISDYSCSPFCTTTLETIKLYSATQCDSDACLIIRLWLCKMESTSKQKLVTNSNIADGRWTLLCVVWDCKLISSIRWAYNPITFYLLKTFRRIISRTGEGERKK